jgi:thiamine biosynthesis lipoprotein
MQYSQQLFADNKKLFYAWFQAMFTRVDIIIWDETVNNNLIEIVEKIEAEISRIESFSNRFDTNSELSYVNANAFNRPIEISDELFKILTDCLIFNELTYGLFDITINSQNETKSGINNIELNTNSKSIKFLHTDVQLDLSGYIKGYALKSIMKIIENEHIENTLINIGNSSSFGKGNHPFGSGWKIGIPDIATDCVLHNECLTTSGNTVKTKWPIKNPKNDNGLLLSQPISVITSDPSIGEIVSTSAYIASENELASILKYFEAKIIN